MLFAKIKNFSYEKIWNEKLEKFNINNFDINDLPSKCILELNSKYIALSKWVSPKRTRSYPYARIYDSFNSCSGKIATIIPIIKDEGYDGDMDYLQWDTISLMSLLNVYVILAFYDKAEKNVRNINKPNKITNQKFNNKFIYNQLVELNNYHQSALHWNIDQLNAQKLSNIIDLSKKAYKNIFTNLKILPHKEANIDKFVKNITNNLEDFINFSRNKSMQAQNREFLTIQPKEYLAIGNKSKITIANYLGGYYYFTVDNVFYKNKILFLMESKHSSNSILPSNNDIKDGLLKLMLYNNISEIKYMGKKNKFKVILHLTSNKLINSIKLPNKNISSFIKSNSISENQSEMLNKLNIECEKNNFSIYIERV